MTSNPAREVVIEHLVQRDLYFASIDGAYLKDAIRNKPYKLMTDMELVSEVEKWDLEDVPGLVLLALQALRGHE